MERIVRGAEVPAKTKKIALSVKELAAMLGVSESAVYWMCHRNEIPHRRTKARGKKGQGKILFSVDAIKEWLKGDVQTKMAR